MLSFFFTASTLVGFDSAGHIAEETKDARCVSRFIFNQLNFETFIASVVAARSIFTSAIATGIGGFITIIVFLFCTPDIPTLLSFNAPQPFVIIYTMALGRGGAAFMTALAAFQLAIVSP